MNKNLYTVASKEAPRTAITFFRVLKCPSAQFAADACWNQFSRISRNNELSIDGLKVRVDTAEAGFDVKGNNAKWFRIVKFIDHKPERTVVYEYRFIWDDKGEL